MAGYESPLRRSGAKAPEPVKPAPQPYTSVVRRNTAPTAPKEKEESDVDLARRLRALTKAKRSAEETAEETERLERLRVAHESDLLRGKRGDGNYEEFLRAAMRKAKEKLKALRGELELQKTKEEFVVLVPAGLKPQPARFAVTLLTENEILYLARALDAQAQTYAIQSGHPAVSAKPLPMEERDGPFRSLAQYLLYCLEYCGVEWKLINKPIPEQPRDYVSISESIRTYTKAHKAHKEEDAKDNEDDTDNEGETTEEEASNE